MKLVEVVRSPLTDPAVFETMADFGRRLGKVAIKAADKTGFVVNRLLVPYLLDAMRVWQEGTAALGDVDTAMTNGAGHPMGPFALADFIGLDVVFHMASNLYEEYREPRLAPPPVLRRLVLAGQLGRKSGRGFYDYSERPPRPNPALAR
jgi:3-hydroxybutyryl-CoA dehydrogenase